MKEDIKIGEMKNKKLDEERVVKGAETIEKSIEAAEEKYGHAKIISKQGVVMVKVGDQILLNVSKIDFEYDCQKLDHFKVNISVMVPEVDVDLPRGTIQIDKG